MRILQVTSYYFPELKFGGPPLKIHALSKGLRQHGHEVSVLTFFSEAAARCEVVDCEGVRVRYLPWSGSGLRQWPRDRAALTAEVRAADVVHVHGLYNLLGPLAMRAARRAGRPSTCSAT